MSRFGGELDVDADRERAARHDAESAPFADAHHEIVEPSDLADEMSREESLAWLRRQVRS